MESARTSLGMRLPHEFYQRTDVVQISRDLLGKVLVTNFNGLYTAGRITETEAYRAPDDRACHAWGNRRTARTEVMFGPGGAAYVFMLYGMHYLFNVVTAPENQAHAVLIRALEPLEGVDIMRERRGGKNPALVTLTTGPGALCQALGITSKWTGQRLDDPGSLLWIEDRGEVIAEDNIAAGKRIGVDYAGEAAEWPWRFWLRDSPFVKKEPAKVKARNVHDRPYKPPPLFG
jgi:DNA-3-methyladenine glycosylase